MGSDALGGCLSPGRKRKLAAHIADCYACRDYEAGLRRIDAGVKILAVPGRSPEDWKASLERLTARLTAEPVSRESRKSAWGVFPKSRLAWSGAASVFVLALGLLAVFIFKGRRPFPEYMPVSMEDALGRIYDRIGNNADLEAGFETVLQASIGEQAGENSADVGRLLNRNSEFVESLSDEDLGVLDAEIGRQLKL